MKKVMENADNSLLSIRFVGQGFTKNTMPIYELGNTFIAIQRVVHKTHLFSTSRLEKGARLSFDERRELALRISEIKEGSDEYIG